MLKLELDVPILRGMGALVIFYAKNFLFLRRFADKTHSVRCGLNAAAREVYLRRTLTTVQLSLCFLWDGRFFADE